jgi:hypothetical protein
MTYLVVNPDWTVPPTILRNDSLPAIKRDRAYLDKQRMDVIERNGRVVDPSTIDWNNITAKNFPYMLRQRPGPTNALGRIKFMFPNEHFVFLHDTPSRELFNRDERAFSSGCIRVEHPFELAEILLRGDPKWTPAEVERVLKSEKTQTISLQRPVPIVRTRNRWEAPASVAQTCPEMLNQRLQLSDEIEDLPVEACCVRELSARFNGGPIPAKFALTEIGGRTVCLDFEERDPGAAPAVSRTAAGHQPGV